MKVQKRTDLDFVKTNPDFERYVRIYSRSFNNIYENTLKEYSDKNELEGFVKISFGNTTIFRKCVGANIKSGIIELGYRTMSELHVNYEEEVIVKPAKWFEYFWNNSESYIKYPFVIAVISIIISFISFFLTILCTYKTFFP